MDASSTNTETPVSLRVATGIRDLVDDYDVFLLDMWGVMHDGITTYPGVLEAVSKLRQAGKQIVILSNSSKRQENSVKVLNKLGFNALSDFDLLITSGEVTHQLLSGNLPSDSVLAPQPWKRLDDTANSKTIFCFGSGAGDQEYIESCGWTLAPIDQAEVIVARGTFTLCDGTSVVDKTVNGDDAYCEAYDRVLATAAQRTLPMIVANPDKIRPDADRSPMPGTIGMSYHEALLKRNVDSSTADELIKYIGKPFEDIFEIALRGRDLSRTCMVGDALETDVTGGSAHGVDTIWVIRDGIHNVEVEGDGTCSMEEGCRRVLEIFNGNNETYAKGRKLDPTIVVPHFQW